MNRLATTAVLALTSLAPALSIYAQAPAAAPTAATTPATTAIAPPLLPFTTHYRYWPVQYGQWLGTELPYSMILLEVDPRGKHPLLDVTLTERPSGKRIHYSDDDGVLATAAAMGEEAHKTAIAYEPADNDSSGSVTSIRFAMADGKPLQWRFVQGSDVSEQGSGLSPLPDSKIPIFAYRERAAVAGEGTALQIGDTVSTATVWTEISQPPYFVAYHGARSEDVHTLVFMPGATHWNVAVSPAALTAGASWELDEEHGNHLSLHIDKVAGDHITFTATDRFEPGIQRVVEASRSGDGWAIERVRFAPEHDGGKHFLALQFASPLPTAPGGAAATTQLFLKAGDKTIASGSIMPKSGGAAPGETLSFSNPDWLNGKTVIVGNTPAAPAVATATRP